ncbi:MAG: Uma2 family endonuclease [Gemmataceae bacterium]
MPRIRSPFPQDATLADVLKQLGGVSPRRVRMHPAPGTATEGDLLAVLDHGNRLCELIDGILVDKPMGTLESCLASELIRLLGNFVVEQDRGIITAPDATLRLMPGLVRLPDVAFISWNQLPSRKYPSEPIASLVPELAVEVLSESNTRGEMQRKLKEYFLAGTQLVWMVDPGARKVDVYTAPDQFVSLREEEVLDGGAVLSGFRLPLHHLFARVEKRLRRRGSRRKKSGS